MTNSADADQLASSEANWSGSTPFAKTGNVVFSKRRVKFSWAIKPALLQALRGSSPINNVWMYTWKHCWRASLHLKRLWYPDCFTRTIDVGVQCWPLSPNDICSLIKLNEYTFMRCDSVRIQWNLNSSNADDLFTMVNSNSFLSPHEIHPIAQENKYLGI